MRWLLVLSVLLAAGCDDGEAAAPDADASEVAGPDATVDTAADTEVDTSVDTGPDLVTDADPDAGPVDAAADTDAPKAPAEVVSTQVTLTTSDGKSLAALASTSADVPEGAPGVLLLHQFGSTKAQWEPYLQALTGAGYLVLSIDLRGHGDSDDQDGSFNGILTDPDGAPRDVRAGLDWLAGPGGAPPDRLAIIGTSIGANLTCAALAGDDPPKLGVALSARDTAVAALASKAAAELSFTGLFILATEDDGGGAQAATADAFYEQTSLPRQKLIFPGSAHGKDLLAERPTLMTTILLWLDLL